MTYPFMADPLPPGHGEALRQPERARTYAVVLVYPDGNPRIQSRWGDLQAALDKAEEERAWHLAHGHTKGSFHVHVEDDDDPERGPLSEEDL